jgi:hypothetical protein
MDMKPGDELIVRNTFTSLNRVDHNRDERVTCLAVGFNPRKVKDIVNYNVDSIYGGGITILVMTQSGSLSWTFARRFIKREV